MPRRRSTDRIDVNAVCGGGGEMGALMRALDWSTTPIGPVESWSPALRMMVRFLLANRFPLLLWWGPQYVSIYNDAYRPVLGAKHPWALGKPVSECWSEIWHILQPLIDTPFTGGPATWNEDILLEINRHGFIEETHFTIAYSAVPDETLQTGIGGVLATVHEITEKVVAERRVVALRDLGAHVGEAKTAEEACAIAAHTLSRHDKDIPFVLLYLMEEGGTRARLAGSTGAKPGDGFSPVTIDVRDTTGGWPFAEALQRNALQMVARLDECFASVPPSPWSDPPQSAIVLPIPSNKAHEPAGLMVAGLSPRLKFDAYYQDFLELVRTQVSAAVANARAYEEERKRAEALAEIDRAKTAFFSNVSHEFRTPLTLMLGPTEDLLAGDHGELTAEQRVQIELLRRSELRLQRLVNALLEFSRIEAGRIRASYEPVDLVAFTRDLASSFRTAIERAGLTFDVQCDPLDEPVFVDPDMWEQIVLNLLSNAFKFTFDGGVVVSLRSDDSHVVLRVQDTGVGVRPEDVGRLFERFHRIEGTRARTHEGSGIGLALVQELVHLHGGSIRAESTHGSGTSFTVTIPKGSAHLPQERVGASRRQRHSGTGALSFVEEALRWLPSETSERHDDAGPTAPVDARILVVDDNADMRDYLRRILELRWRVETATDGETALGAVRACRPDLILTDIMMPVVDGFGLLQRLRADPEMASIPVIMLSARADEEARVEGLDAGAADYLIKPFSARELLARVRTHLESARLRNVVRAQRERLYEMFMQAPVPICVFRGEDMVFEMANALYYDVAGHRDLIGKPLLEGIPEARGQGFDDLLRDVMKTGRPYVGKETLVRLDRDHDGVPEDAFFTFTYAPLFEADGTSDRVMAVVNDVTEQVLARRSVEASEARFRTIFETAEVSLWEEDFTDLRGLVDRLAEEHGAGLRSFLEANADVVAQAIRLVRVRDVNPATLRLFGAATKAEMLGSLDRVFLPESRAVFLEELVAMAEHRRLVFVDAPLQTLAGERVDVAMTIGFPSTDEGYDRVLVTLMDISSRKQAEREREARVAEMERAVRFSEMFVGILGHDLRNPLSAITTAANLLEVRADSERIAKPVARILLSADRMDRMISQLLDFTRIRLGRGLPLERAHVDLSDVARSIIEELAAVHRRDIHLDVTGDVAGLWDRDRLHQLLSNLVDNACRHGTPAAPVHVVVDGTDADAIRLSVRNHGVIPTEVRALLFDPFGSSGRRQKRDGTRGLGLGLYISRQITMAHGGTLTVTSTDEAGTTFAVEIPRHSVGDSEDLFRSAGALS